MLEKCQDEKPSWEEIGQLTEDNRRLQAANQDLYVDLVYFKSQVESLWAENARLSQEAQVLSSHKIGESILAEQLKRQDELVAQLIEQNKHLADEIRQHKDDYDILKAECNDAIGLEEDLSYCDNEAAKLATANAVLLERVKILEKKEQDNAGEYEGLLYTYSGDKAVPD